MTVLPSFVIDECTHAPCEDANAERPNSPPRDGHTIPHTIRPGVAVDISSIVAVVLGSVERTGSAGHVGAGGGVGLGNHLTRPHCFPSHHKGSS